MGKMLLKIRCLVFAGHMWHGIVILWVTPRNGPCSCSAPALALAPVSDYFPVHIHNFTFDSAPRLLMWLFLKPVLNHCTWITFYFLKQTTVCLVKIKNSTLQNHFWTKSESNMYPMLLHRMFDRISAAVLHVHDFTFDYTSSPAMWSL